MYGLLGLLHEEINFRYHCQLHQTPLAEVYVRPVLFHLALYEAGDVSSSSNFAAWYKSP